MEEIKQITTDPPEGKLKKKRSIYTLHCMVPYCMNTGDKESGRDKKYFRLPTENEKIDVWLKACKIDRKTLPIGRNYVCSYHFNLEEDTLNYGEANLHGIQYLKLKPDAIPHIFPCQKKGVAENKRSICKEKRKQKIILYEIHGIFDEHGTAKLTELEKHPRKQTTQAVTATTSTEELSNQDLGFETKSEFADMLQHAVEHESNSTKGKNGTGTSTLIKNEPASDSMDINSEIEFEFINVKQECVDELSEVDLHLDKANQMDTCTDNTQTMDPKCSMNEMSRGENVSDIKKSVNSLPGPQKSTKTIRRIEESQQITTDPLEGKLKKKKRSICTLRCIVPYCVNAGSKGFGRNKKYFRLPKENKKIDVWLKACKRDRKTLPVGRNYVCSDHFNLEEDTYVEANLHGIQYLKLKRNAIPHIFACRKKGDDRIKLSICTKKRKETILLYKIYGTFNEPGTAELTELEKHPRKQTTQAVKATTSAEELSNQDLGFETKSEFADMLQHVVEHDESNSTQGKNGTGTSTPIKSEPASDNIGIKSEIEFDFMNVKQEHVDELSEVDLHLDNANQMDTCTDNTQTMDPECSMNETSQGDIVSDIKIEHGECDHTEIIDITADGRDANEGMLMEPWPCSSEFANQQMMMSTLLTGEESNQEMSSTCKKCSSVCASSEFCDACITKNNKSYDMILETSSHLEDITNQALEMNLTTEVVDKFQCRICGDVYDNISRFICHYPECSNNHTELHTSDADASLFSNIKFVIASQAVIQRDPTIEVSNKFRCRDCRIFFDATNISSMLKQPCLANSNFPVVHPLIIDKKLTSVSALLLCWQLLQQQMECHVVTEKCIQNCVSYYFCPYCLCAFNSSNELLGHIKLKQEDVNNRKIREMHAIKAKCTCICCPCCSKHHFRSNGTYNNHLKLDSPRKIDIIDSHICDTCNRNFKYGCSLFRHHHKYECKPSKEFKCIHCEVIFPSEITYKIHKNICSQFMYDLEYVHTNSGEIFYHKHTTRNVPNKTIKHQIVRTNKNQLDEDHEDLYHKLIQNVPDVLKRLPQGTKRKYICHLCTAEFIKQQSLKLHSKTFCQKHQILYLSTFFPFLKPRYGVESMRYRFRHFNKPLKTEVNAVIYFVCPYCFVLYDDEKLFMFHIGLQFTAPYENFTNSCKMMFHSDNIICPLCFEKMDSKFSYNVHIRTHFPHDCYPCVHCKVGFNFICQLNNHHSNKCVKKEENQFVSCYHCKTTFPSKLSYLVHFEMCKFIICRICTCKFSTSKELEIHEIKSHGCQTLKCTTTSQTTTSQVIATKKPRKQNLSCNILKQDETVSSVSTTDDVEFIV